MRRISLPSSVAIGIVMVLPFSVAGQSRYAAEKVVSVGDGKSDDVAITDIAALVVDKGLHAYVAQGSEVWKFDSNGKLLAKLGKKGGGPGEYNSIFSMGLLGDTVWVADPAQGRVTLLAKDKAVATFRMDNNGTQSPVLAIARNHSVLLRTYDLNPQGDVLAGTLSLRELDGRQRALQSLFLKNKNVTLRFGDGMMNFSHPFDDSDMIAAAPDGKTTFVVSRAIPPSGATASFTIHSFSSDGRRIASVVKPYAPLVVKKSDYEKLIADYLSALKETNLFKRHPVDAQVAFRAAVPQPKFLPAWKNAIVASDGQLWLQPWSPPSAPKVEPVVWSVVGAGGVVTALVSLPRQLRVQAVSSGAVWGYEVSEDDEIILVKYVLRKA